MTSATFSVARAGGSRGPAVLTFALLAAALAVAIAELGPAIARLATDPSSADGFDLERMVLLYSSLPRLVTSLLCGGALAAAGAILQQVMRNPLASPTTLGISAGAHLALALAGVFAPALLGFGRDLVALAGSAAAALLVLALARRQGFAPIPLILSGLVVGLYCGALSAVLVLMNDRTLVSLFIWGSGSLSQQDWTIPVGLGLRLIVLALFAGLLVRPLSLLDIEDDGARALGLSLFWVRGLAVALAVAIAAFITAAVGLIGFIGLVAPTLARLSGARRFGERLFWSTTIGAGLLWLTDGAVQAMSDVSGDFLPTGAVTALFGSPLLILLLPRLRFAAKPRSAPKATPASARAPVLLLAGLGLMLVVLVLVSAFFGHDPGGDWSWLSLDDWGAVSPWRLPRMTGALAAGAMLAIAGTLLQKMTGNEMASPEILGIGAGVTIGVTVALFSATAVGPIGQTLSGFLGALAVLALILAFARHSGFAPERVLLVGIALNALIDALVGVLSAGGDPRASLLLSWVGGSAFAIDAEKATISGLAAIGLGLGALLSARWLAVLPLGDAQSRTLGLPLGPARLVILMLTAGLTAFATSIVGPLSFVGLMGPHIVNSLGLRRPLPALIGSLLAGAALMVSADFVARTIAFPWQLPTGLTAALVGVPILLWLFQRNSRA